MATEVEVAYGGREPSLPKYPAAPNTPDLAKMTGQKSTPRVRVQNINVLSGNVLIRTSIYDKHSGAMKITTPGSFESL